MNSVEDTAIQRASVESGTAAAASLHHALNGLFFVGTDTGVGKTFVTAAVTRLLRRQGHSVAVCKPVATGGQWVGEQWLCEDTVCLAGAAEIYGDWTRVTPWAFPDPVAPPVVGVVVSERVPPEGLASETNVAELQRRISAPLLAVIPHRTSRRERRAGSRRHRLVAALLPG